MTRQPLRTIEYLEHILEAMERAARWLDDVPGVEAFQQAWKEQDAVVRCIAVVGEAATKVLKADPQFVAQHSEVPWEKMSTMRNRVVHDYFEIDLDVVWATVTRDFVPVQAALRAILRSLGA